MNINTIYLDGFDVQDSVNTSVLLDEESDVIFVDACCFKNPFQFLERHYHDLQCAHFIFHSFMTKRPLPFLESMTACILRESSRPEYVSRRAFSKKDFCEATFPMWRDIDKHWDLCSRKDPKGRCSKLVVNCHTGTCTLRPELEPLEKLDPSLVFSSAHIGPTKIGRCVMLSALHPKSIHVLITKFSMGKYSFLATVGIPAKEICKFYHVTSKCLDGGCSADALVFATAKDLRTRRIAIVFSADELERLDEVASRVDMAIISLDLAEKSKEMLSCCFQHMCMVQTAAYLMFVGV